MDRSLPGGAGAPQRRPGEAGAQGERPGPRDAARQGGNDLGVVVFGIWNSPPSPPPKKKEVGLTPQKKMSEVGGLFCFSL